jgi:hypothetical protein
MLSALKFVYFWVHVNETTLNSFSSHLKLTEQRLINCLLKSKLYDNAFPKCRLCFYSWAAATMINRCFCELLLPILNFSILFIADILIFSHFCLKGVSHEIFYAFFHVKTDVSPNNFLDETSMFTVQWTMFKIKWLASGVLLNQVSYAFKI